MKSSFQKISFEKAATFQVAMNSLVLAFVCGFIPFAFVENPHFANFCYALNPGFKLPSRGRLSGVLLDYVYNQISNEVTERIHRASNLVLTSDEW